MSRAVKTPVVKRCSLTSLLPLPSLSPPHPPHARARRVVRVNKQTALSAVRAVTAPQLSTPQPPQQAARDAANRNLCFVQCTACCLPLVLRLVVSCCLLYDVDTAEIAGGGAAALLLTEASGQQSSTSTSGEVARATSAPAAASTCSEVLTRCRAAHSVTRCPSPPASTKQRAQKQHAYPAATAAIAIVIGIRLIVASTEPPFSQTNRQFEERNH